MISKYSVAAALLLFLCVAQGSGELMPLKSTKKEIGLFVEGLIYGVLDEEYTDLHECLSESTEFENDLIQAVEHFEKETLQDIKEGLHLLGSAIKLVPTMAKDCASIKADLKNLEELSKILMHPMSLVYHAGKNLIINGIDIYHKMEAAIKSKKEGDYFNFGKFVGEALAELVLNAKEMTNEDFKAQIDAQAYLFLKGFFEGLRIQIDESKLMNGVSGIGLMIFGPVRNTMKELTASNGQLNQRVWMTIHEVSHSFLEGGQVLVAKGALTQNQVDQVREMAECLNAWKFDQSVNSDVQGLFKDVLTHYNAEQIEEVGKTFSQIAAKLCGDKFILY